MVSHRFKSAFALAFAVCMTATAFAQTPSAESRLTLDKDRFLGAPISFRNLTLIPVYAPQAKATDAYMTLEEGLKAKVVTVREKSGGGEVNELLVSNNGKKPLYIMAGEVILGGQQDRSFGNDTIVPPGKKDIPIAAFCVEHGRWNGKARFDESAKSVASLDIRASAQEGGFYSRVPAMAAGSAGAGRASAMGGSFGSGRARQQANAAAQNQQVQAARPAAEAAQAPATIVSRSQQEVWDKVAKKNARFKTSNATGTYRTLVNAEAEHTEKDLAAYLKAFPTFGRDPQTVGAVVAVNGKIVAADLFSDPGLFRKLWGKLLRAYAADALENAPNAKKPLPVVTAQMGKNFLLSASDAKSQLVNKSAVSSTVRLESKEARLYRLEAQGKRPGAAGMMGGGLGGVHTSVVGK